MVREERGKPLAGPRGALGISSETTVALGKVRRTTTNAPPALMFMAVANSSKSLPLSSRLRTNTGMANCNRAHFRFSVLGELRLGTRPSGKQGLTAKMPHLMGQTTPVSGSKPESRGISQPTLELPDFYRCAASRGSRMANLPKVQGFSLECRFDCISD
jgi:hypothetical protein